MEEIDTSPRNDILLSPSEQLLDSYLKDYNLNSLYISVLKLTEAAQSNINNELEVVMIQKCIENENEKENTSSCLTFLSFVFTNKLLSPLPIVIQNILDIDKITKVIRETEKTSSVFQDGQNVPVIQRIIILAYLIPHHQFDLLPFNYIEKQYLSLVIKLKKSFISMEIEKQNEVHKLITQLKSIGNEQSILWIINIEGIDSAKSKPEFAEEKEKERELIEKTKNDLLNDIWDPQPLIDSLPKPIFTLIRRMSLNSEKKNKEKKDQEERERKAMIKKCLKCLQIGDLIGLAPGIKIMVQYYHSENDYEGMQKMIMIGNAIGKNNESNSSSLKFLSFIFEKKFLIPLPLAFKSQLIEGKESFEVKEMSSISSHFQDGLSISLIKRILILSYLLQAKDVNKLSTNFIEKKYLDLIQKIKETFYSMNDNMIEQLFDLIKQLEFIGNEQSLLWEIASKKLNKDNYPQKHLENEKFLIEKTKNELLRELWDPQDLVEILFPPKAKKINEKEITETIESEKTDNNKNLIESVVNEPEIKETQSEKYDKSIDLDTNLKTDNNKNLIESIVNEPEIKENQSEKYDKSIDLDTNLNISDLLLKHQNLQEETEEEDLNLTDEDFIDNIPKENYVEVKNNGLFNLAPTIYLHFDFEFENLTEEILENLKSQIAEQLNYKYEFQIIKIERGSTNIFLMFTQIFSDIISEMSKIDISDEEIEKLKNNTQNTMKEIEKILNDKNFTLGNENLQCKAFAFIPDISKKKIKDTLFKNLSDIILNEDNKFNNESDIMKAINIDKLKIFIKKKVNLIERNAFDTVKKLIKEYSINFEFELRRMQKNSIIEFYTIIEMIINKSDKKFIYYRDKCRNKEELYLVHGTQTKFAYNILKDKFIQGDAVQNGKGIYFTDSLDYVGFYVSTEKEIDLNKNWEEDLFSPRNKRDNINRIRGKNERFGFIGAVLFYNKNLIKFLNCANGKEIEENGINIARVESVKLRTIDEKVYNTMKESKKVIFNEYAINSKYNQIYPLFYVVVERKEFFILWRDTFLGSKKQIFTSFLKNAREFICSNLGYNAYFEKSTKDALKLLIRKKYNKVILITNIGPGAKISKKSGIEFVKYARKILCSNVIVLFVTSTGTNYEYIKDIPNCILAVMEELDFIKEYIENFNEEGLKKIKNDYEQKHNKKLRDFDDDLLRFPLYKEGGEKYSDLEVESNEEINEIVESFNIQNVKF